MRYLFTLCCSALVGLSGLSVFAQGTTLSTQNFYKPWTTYVRKGYAPTEGAMQLLKTTSGNGVTWDVGFLASDFALGTDTLEVVPLPATYTYFPAYYDTSNLMIRIRDDFGSNYYAHLLKSADSVLYIGSNAFGVTGMVESVFQRFEDQFFPLELGSSMGLGFQRHYQFNAIWVDASGSDDHYILQATEDMVVDGQGDFIRLGGDTLHDVLRIRTILDYTDSNQTFGVQHYTDTLFSWYSPDYTCPLLHIRGGNYAMNYQYFSVFPLAYYELNNSHLISLAGFPSIDPAEIRVYPNPAAEDIYLLLPGPTTGRLALYDAGGRLCLQQEFQGSKLQLATGTLAPGTYTLEIRSDQQAPVIRKLVLQPR